MTEYNGEKNNSGQECSMYSQQNDRKIKNRYKNDEIYHSNIERELLFQNEIKTVKRFFVSLLPVHFYFSYYNEPHLSVVQLLYVNYEMSHYYILHY